MDEIYNRETGFRSLLNYLRNSVSCNNIIIDTMTLNYDRSIEIVCDSLKIKAITGFKGNIMNHYSDTYIRDINKKEFDVRLFKSHGSLNWIENDA